ncbi:diguanylate cyclase (GGDEF domain) [Sulfurimonas gotlandica GD1]|uniref:diguanylate cyclase n=1 Tax=Sulfurimonas gotlandica (strain DSM 19862 / JCM 16533 / GD1) TaxID=929558 RepID=B6BGP2_SULGG|nr:GGDEF domain-containing protein [Sulfurimonas gotlandica]EDZ63610.1 diguanylate cyclase [Sulfurimonas gotlandica GD1]EHP29673.1 diguanylate cyclase (GGDEF domain) [Sulfurimonas gotlandica GD1]
MISYDEKKHLVYKAIFIVASALIVLSIVRILVLHHDAQDIALIYDLIFKEMFFSISSAVFIIFILYLSIKKELYQVNNKAVTYAFKDALTGLNNRHYLNNFLENFTSLRKEDTDFAVVFIDIDRFKLINDSLGHSTGDCILKSLALSLQSLIRPGDTLCRYGGEEFVIIFTEIYKQDVLRKVEQIRESIERRTFECKEQKITISAGISFGLRDDDINEVMEHSDKALYMAKDAGRNCVKVFNLTQ